MYSIKNNIDNTIIIKKSRFITKLYKVDNINEINIILANVKKEYKDSTHICYAYIINGIEKCSDDGEPSGTAGLPILNVLQKNNLNYILAIVIRYFGGIKLGAGGLVRAYSNSVVETLKLTDRAELIDGYDICIQFDYNNIKNIDSLLSDNSVYDKIFNEIISYSLNISQNDFYKIKEKLKALCIDIKINKEILLTKNQEL